MKRKEIIPKEKKEGKKKTIKHEVLQITKRIDIHPKIDLQIDIDKLNVRSIQKYKATSRKGLTTTEGRTKWRQEYILHHITSLQPQSNRIGMIFCLEVTRGMGSKSQGLYIQDSSPWEGSLSPLKNKVVGSQLSRIGVPPSNGIKSSGYLEIEFKDMQTFVDGLSQKEDVRVHNNMSLMEVHSMVSFDISFTEPKTYRCKMKSLMLVRVHSNLWYFFHKISHLKILSIIPMIFLDICIVNIFTNINILITHNTENDE